MITVEETKCQYDFCGKHCAIIKDKCRVGEYYFRFEFVQCLGVCSMCVCDKTIDKMWAKIERNTKKIGDKPLPWKALLQSVLGK